MMMLRRRTAGFYYAICENIEPYKYYMIHFNWVTGQGGGLGGGGQGKKGVSSKPGAHRDSLSSSTAPSRSYCALAGRDDDCGIRGVSTRGLDVCRPRNRRRQ